MTAGDDAALFGFTPVLSTDERRQGYSRINDAADFGAKMGRLRFATAAALIAYTAKAQRGQRAVDLATGDEYRFNGTAWQLWTTDFKSYTPTFTGFTLGNGTLSVWYRYVDGQVFYYGTVTLGSTSAMTGPFLASLPVTAVSQIPVIAKAHGNIGTTNPFPLFPTFSSTTTMQLRSFSGATTAPLSATSPATWAATHTIEFSALYRVY